MSPTTEATTTANLTFMLTHDRLMPLTLQLTEPAPFPANPAISTQQVDE